VRIARQKILESAIKVMDLGIFRALLEVEYFGESGSGLGPTLEFYTLVSRELQRADLDLFYADGRKPTADGYVDTLSGLYPTPVPPAQEAQQGDAQTRREALFTFLGTFMAKTLMDQRLLDMPFSDALLKWMLGHPLTVDDVCAMSSQVGSSLSKFARIARAYSAAQHRSATAAEATTPPEFLIKGETVAEQYLTFTFPGVPDWELVPGGKGKDVTLETVGDFVTCVTQAFLGGATGRLLAALRTGFNKVVPMDRLQVFSTAEELRAVLCGESEAAVAQLWSEEAIMGALRCDHGYTRESAQVQDLVWVMAHELTAEDRRLFVQFLTGSPHLPVGGFAALNPKFTIVRRGEDRGEMADIHLPTVSACFYYLKLPNYSSRAILKSRLIYAIHHGQGSFDLT
jgi:E3 ubiquitin-protein ligase TRIP12